MLLVDKKKIRFADRTYQKILHVTPVLDGGICFVGTYQFRRDCLTHMDKEGKVVN